MAATIVDYQVFRNVVGTEAMGASDENRTANYLDVERALAVVQRPGVIRRKITTRSRATAISAGSTWTSCVWRPSAPARR